MTTSIKLAIVNDYPIVLAGMTAVLAPYADWIEIVETTTKSHQVTPTDVTLLDAFGSVNIRQRAEQVLAADTHTRLALFTWNFDAAEVDAAFAADARGYLSKQLDGAGLATAIEQIYDGKIVRSDPPEPNSNPASAYDWPGQDVGLSERQAEILSLIAQGLSNDEVARTLYLSINTVKTYIRLIYKKIGVPTRTRALLWAQDHGLGQAGADLVSSPGDEEDEL